MRLKGLNEKLAMAIMHASVAHVGQGDKGGEAYILHCLAVMELVRPYGKMAMMAAVLHDLKEDHPGYWEANGLVQLWPAEVRAAINCLTRDPAEDYLDSYIARIAGHPLARKVKMADLTHNMDTGRLPDRDIGENDYERWDKYRRALVQLKQAEEGAV